MKEYVRNIMFVLILAIAPNTLIGDIKEFGLKNQIEYYSKLQDDESKANFLFSFNEFLQNSDAHQLRETSENLLRTNKHIPGSKAYFLLMLCLAESDKKLNQFSKVDGIFEEIVNSYDSLTYPDNTLFGFIYWKYSYAMSHNEFDYSEAIKRSEKGKVIVSRSNSNRLKFKYFNNLAFYYEQLGDLPKSIKYIRLARNYAEGSINIVNSNMDYIVAFFENGEYEEAKKIWQGTEPLLDDTFPGKQKAHAYQMAATLYRSLGDFDKAMKYIDITIKEDSMENAVLRYGFGEMVKGRIYKSMGKVKLAEYYLRESSKKAHDVNKPTLRSLCGTTLAEILIQQKKYSEAQLVLQDAYRSSTLIKKEYKANLEEQLVQVFESQNNLDSALYYQKRLQETKQELMNKDKERQLALIKIEMEIDEFEKKNETLQAENLELGKINFRKVQENKFIILSLFFAFLLFILYTFNRSQKSKLKQELSEEKIRNNERIAIEAELGAIRSQMSPHFMFNALNSINEYIQDHKPDIASDYLVKFSRLMRATLSYSKEKFVTLKEELEILKLYLELENLRFNQSIVFKFIIDETINKQYLKIPPMMIQPFVENAIWHGLMPKKGERSLIVKFEMKNGILLCEVEDNGIGRVASKKFQNLTKKHKSSGVGLTQRRVQLMEKLYNAKASVVIEDLAQKSETIGTRVLIYLPVKESDE